MKIPTPKIVVPVLKYILWAIALFLLSPLLALASPWIVASILSYLLINLIRYVIEAEIQNTWNISLFKPDGKGILDADEAYQWLLLIAIVISWVYLGINFEAHKVWYVDTLIWRNLKIKEFFNLFNFIESWIC